MAENSDRLWFEEWLSALNSAEIISMFQDANCDEIFIKRLAPNDNAKNQIYVGNDLTNVALIPSGNVLLREGSSKKVLASGQSIYSCQLNFEWLLPNGSSRAPNAQFIYYPQYPEVRISGLLRGVTTGPNSLLDPLRRGREPGRLLLLGTSPSSERVYGLLLPPESPAAYFLSQTKHEGYGALERWRVRLRSEILDAKEQLLEELCRIHKSGWIPGKRLRPTGAVPYAAQNGGGYTLEAELGILPNGNGAPDFHGWEIKQHGVVRLDRPRRSAITLLTPEPDGGAYSENGVLEFAKIWGRDSAHIAHRIDFGGIHKAGARNERTGLTLNISGYALGDREPSENGSLFLSSDSGEVAASWSFEKILTHWKRKHSAAAFVPSEKQMNPNSIGPGATEYRFGNEINLGEGTTFAKFLDGLLEQRIYYDPGIHVALSNGEWIAKKRNQFRVNSSLICSLYESTSLISACSDEF